MIAVSSAKVKIPGVNHALDETLSLYREAVSFFIDVCEREWDALENLSTLGARAALEKMCITTKARSQVPYDFKSLDGTRFAKFPSYLRRDAIAQAISTVSSYHAAMGRWKAPEPKKRGKKPRLNRYPKAWPVLYRGNCARLHLDSYEVEIKAFVHNTWDWLHVRLRRSDVDYILAHHAGDDMSSPRLVRSGKRWGLVFSFSREVALPEGIPEKVLAVDLGLTRACTCSVVTPSGAVLVRDFLSLGGEYDCLGHRLSRVRAANHRDSGRCPRLWALAKASSEDIARRTADHIMGVARENGVGCIVFEHLDFSGSRRSEPLQHWRWGRVQELVECRAHREGIRVSRVLAAGTSKLAFDGTGEVARGAKAGFKDGRTCRFKTGKVYDADLNASMNIGARYYVREMIKTLPETAGQRLRAEVPGIAQRSTCTLSTLWGLNRAISRWKGTPDGTRADNGDSQVWKHATLVV